MGYFRPLSQTKFINDANLVSYWNFNESSGNASDSTGNGYTLTNLNTATYSAGKFNNGADTVGASSQAFYNDSFNIGTSLTAWTVSGWFKWTNTGDTTEILLYNTANTHQSILKLNDNAGSGSVGYISAIEYETSNASVVSTANTYNDGNYHHIVQVINGANQYLYIDGVLSKSGSSRNIAFTINKISIAYYRPSPTQYYTGSQDDISVFTRALSAGEVAELYQSQTLGEYLGAGSGTTKLLLHLNGSSADSSGNSNNGTDTSVTYSQANGKFGQGAGFNGSSSKISVASSSSLNVGTGDFTVNFWAKGGSQGDYKGLVCRASSTDPLLGWGLFTVANKFTVQIGNGTSNIEQRTSATVMDSIYRMLTMVRVGNTVTLYVNGSVDGTKTDAIIGANLDTAVALLIGVERSGALWFTGNLDEVILETTAWSASKIQKIYTEQKGRYGII